MKSRYYSRKQNFLRQRRNANESSSNKKARKAYRAMKKFLNVLFVAAMGINKGGSAAFNVANFADFWSNLLKISTNPLSTGFKAFWMFLSAMAALNVNIQTRGFTFFRSEQEKDQDKEMAHLLKEEKAAPLSAEQLELMQPFLTQLAEHENPENPSLVQLEEKETSHPTDMGYLALQITKYVYFYGCATGSVTSTLGFIKMLETVSDFNYAGICQEAEAVSGKFFGSLFLLFLLGGASIKSLLHYTFPAIDEYYLKLFAETRLFTSEKALFNSDTFVQLCTEEGKELPYKTKGGFLFNEPGERVWECTEKLFYKNNQTNSILPLTLKAGLSEIDHRHHALIISSVLMGMFLTWFASQKVNNFLYCDSLPFGASVSLSLLGTLANAMASYLMTIGAAYYKKENERAESQNTQRATSVSTATEEEKREDKEEAKPSCLKLYCSSEDDKLPSEFGEVGGKIMDASILINSINSGLGAFNSIVGTPETWGVSGVAVTGVSTALGIPAGFISEHVQKLLDKDASRREQNVRRAERMVEEEEKDNGVTVQTEPLQRIEERTHQSNAPTSMRERANAAVNNRSRLFAHQAMTLLDSVAFPPEPSRRPQQPASNSTTPTSFRLNVRSSSQ